MNVVENIKSILRDTGKKQRDIADALDVDESIVSNILRGARELKVSELEKIAWGLDVDVTYLLTYPKHFVDAENISNKERVSITFEVHPDNRDSLLKLVLSDK